MKNINNEIINKYITDDNLKILKEYLYTRNLEKRQKGGFSVVFDITNDCNLVCVGCCVNAKNNKSTSNDLTTEQVLEIIEKINDYVEENNYDEVYINFGGGEPFLRKDFDIIIKHTKNSIKNSEIAIDTNGTLLEIDHLIEISPYISNIGVSLDGFEINHNSWRKPKKEILDYSKIINLAIELFNRSEFLSQLEITSVPTKNNIIDLPNFAEYLFDIGFKNYSIHRAMPSGRMLKKYNVIPSSSEYLWLAVEVAKLKLKTEMNVHIHHTLESIYSALFCNINTYSEKKSHKNPNDFSSIAIDHYGNVFLDPWTTVKPWSKLIVGSLLQSNSLSNILSDKNPKFERITRHYKKNNRCNGCHINCSGGSRIAAAANFLEKKHHTIWNLNDILNGLSHQDPACPLILINTVQNHEYSVS